MRRVRLLNISTPFQGLDHDVTLLASGHWMYSGPVPQSGDGTLYGSMLTYNILMNLKPVLSPLPDNELCLLIDVPLGLYVSMDWTNGFEFQIYEDPNAITGIQSALTATGLAAAFVGASGGLEFPLHNLVPFKDMSQWTDSGTAVGAYGAISGLGGSGNYIYKHTTLDVPNGTKIALVTKLKGTNGERTTVEITTTGANNVAAGVDLDGTEQTFVTPLTLNADATRVDARIGQNSDGNAASDVEVLGAWLYFETYGLGAWPMQNLAGFTIDNLPEDLTYGLGVVYNKETGLPDHLGLGAEYRNLVNNPLFVGGTIGILGAGGVLPEGVDLTSETGAEIHRLSDDEMEITVWREAVGQKAYPRIRLSDHLLDAVTPGQSMVGQIEIEVVTNDSAAGVVRASVDFRNKGSYVGDGFVTPDLAVGSSGHYAEIVTVPATSDTGGLSVQVPSTVQDGDTDTVRLIIKRPQLVNNSNIIGLPLIPSIPGGQDTHAAQPFYGDISTFAKLGPDLYSALGQSGAIDNSNIVGANLLTNGDGSSGTTGWTDSVNEGVLTESAGIFRITKSGSANAFTARAYQTITGLTPGKAYIVGAETVAAPGGGTVVISENFNLTGGAPIQFPTAVKLHTPRAFVAQDTDIDFLMTSAGTLNDYAEFDNLSLHEAFGAWISDTGEGRFSVADNVITLAAGSAAEVISLLASPLGLSDGDVVELDVSATASANGFVIREADTGAVLQSMDATTYPTLTDGRFQLVVQNGVVANIRGGNAAGAGTITINDLRKVPQGAWTLAVEYEPIVLEDAAWSVIAGLSDGTNDNTTRLYMNDTGDKTFGEVRQGGAVVAGLSKVGATYAADVTERAVISVATDLADFAQDGVSSGTDSDLGGGPANYSKFGIATSAQGAAQKGMLVKSVAILARKTSQAENEQLAPAEAS